MGNREIEAKGYTLNVVFMIIIFTGIPYFMFCKFSKELVHWENFSDNGFITIVFLVSLLVGILCWVKLLDTAPALIINKKGVWVRKSILPFSPLRFIDWNQIKFVELNLIKGKKSQTTTVLVIHRNDSSKTKTIELDVINYSSEEIISMFREFSNFLNFRDRSVIR
ncbi:hypothetical protein [Flavobacterium sp. JAS]|uniref:hypothetical protein n=1 Tax=Flavobacterium sp. JAS TaxID=2897329 RepID=UPI001E419805|nr:hypothetical protein [Flavobacterium sp. JAS]MCD0470921.1 hypothetical protein [Flavobacterium sp. JAS]